MKNTEYNLGRLFELKDMPFISKYLELDMYRNKREKGFLLMGGNNCLEARKAFGEGLLKDFYIKALKAKNGLRIQKIAQYAKGTSYDRDESYAGHMEVTLVYKAICELSDTFFACRTNITFPMLIRHVIEQQFSKILLIPYISSVEVWKARSHEELMNSYSPKKEIFYFNENVDAELYKNALFALQLYGLDTEENRCLMNIDDYSFPGRYTINIEDLKKNNFQGMYCIRPHLDR